MHWAITILADFRGPAPIAGTFKLLSFVFFRFCRLFRFDLLKSHHDWDHVQLSKERRAIGFFVQLALAREHIDVQGIV
jgi:hypothetical protein